LDYLRFFFTRLAADFTLTMALSALYIAGMPLHSVESWSHGSALLTLLFAVGAACIFVATDSQVATVLSLASIHRRRQFTVSYAVLVVAIAGTAGIAALIGSLQVSLLADRAMLAFAVLSRLLALCTSAAFIIRCRNLRGRAAGTALLYAGYFFILMDGSWLAMYALGMMRLLPARLYDGLHLTRLLFLNGIVVVYLGRFLDVFEGTQVPGSADEQLDPHLVAKYTITRREEEIIRHLRLGRSNEEIAKKLFISTRTVKGHLYRIFQKTNVKNRVQLANLFGNRGKTPSESENPEERRT